MRRRTFLTGVGLGTLATGASVGAAPSSVGAVATGFALGNRIPALSGRNQRGFVRPIRDPQRRWSLIDVCAEWCAPCRQSAELHREYTEYLRGQGVRFRILTVMVEDHAGQTSTRAVAQRWATQYMRSDDDVLHCDGDDQSSLRRLAERVAADNGLLPAFPCYVLVDPNGIVRMVTFGVALNAAQAVIAAATGRDLDRVWPLDPPPSSDGEIIETGTWPLRIRGARTDGRVIDETITRAQPVGATLAGVRSGFVIVGNLGDPGLSLDTPFSIDCALDPPSAAPGRLEIGSLLFAYRNALPDEDPQFLHPEFLAAPITLDDTGGHVAVPPLRTLVGDLPYLDSVTFYGMEAELWLRQTRVDRAAKALLADLTADPRIPDWVRWQVRSATLAMIARIREADWSGAAVQANRVVRLLGSRGTKQTRVHALSLARYLTAKAAGGETARTANRRAPAGRISLLVPPRPAGR